jgi:hypothetical protein
VSALGVLKCGGKFKVHNKIDTPLQRVPHRRSCSASFSAKLFHPTVLIIELRQLIARGASFSAKSAHLRTFFHFKEQSFEGEQLIWQI